VKCQTASVSKQWLRLCVIDLIMTSLLLLFTLTLLSLSVRCLPVEEEYQYDDPTDEVGSREEEVAATWDIEMVTRTTEFRVRPGDKVALPCEVRTSGSVSRIWSRPDQVSSQIISVGANILDPEQAALFALETDGSLIVLSATESLAGSYQCRIATQESKEVTHSVRIVPDSGIMESQELSSGASALLNPLNLAVLSALYLLFQL